MNTFRLTTSLSIFGLLVTLAGCSAQAGTAPSSSEPGTATAAQAQAQDNAAAPGPRFAGHHGGFGPEMVLGAALHEDIGLSDAQKTTLRAALDQTRPSPPAAEESKGKAFGAELAAAVRAGKIDTSALAAKAPAGPSEAMHAAHVEAVKKALSTLHATLTSDQRKKLVSAIEARADQGPPEGRGGEHAHGPREGGPGRGPGNHGPGMHGALGLVADLDLTDAQKETLRQKLEAARPPAPSAEDREARKAAHEAMRADYKARLESFTKDTFDANAFVARPANAQKPDGLGKGAPHEHMLTELAVVTEVLTPAQREKLAQRLEQGPMRPPAGPAAQAR
jgi:Spy/CpxP family protein refolding chaperone